MLQDGDFLIRDSFTSLGDYVLTCRWNQKALHFLVSKRLLKSRDSHSQAQYVLEGEAFDSVPALIHFYVGSRTPLTKRSGALVHSPVNRTLPVRYLETMFGQTGREGTPLQSPVRSKGCMESLGVTEALAIEIINPER